MLKAEAESERESVEQTTECIAVCKSLNALLAWLLSLLE